jgi:serine/threonine protein kinase/Flp pilus assembly protein TadD
MTCFGPTLIWLPMPEGAPLQRSNFGPYQIRDLIAVSGMGVVYRAWDPRLQCFVAIKLVNQDTVSDESAREQLLTEARIASSLDHQNICRIRHVEEADGQTGIVMEFVEGEALSKLIPPHTGLPFDDVVSYGFDIVSAVAHAHQHKVIHRDLKSGNVMVTPDGRIKLLDFGLSKLQVRTDVPGFLSTANGSTSSHTIVGTPPYWAPEVLKREESDVRSDLWSLGVLLYEMATGRMPFQGKTLVELGSSILRDPPYPLPSEVSRPLAKIIQHCLVKEPGGRYQRATEIQTDLGRLQNPQSKWERLKGRFRSRREQTPPPAVKSVAVLPLDNISGSPDQEYFADGMTEALITALTKVSSVRVISRTSIMQYKKVRKAISEIARELGADVIVEGSVLRIGDRVRITAELIQGSTDEHLWAESYERDLRDIFELQSQVAEAIADEIRKKLSPTHVVGPGKTFARMSTTRSTVNPKAYDLYLKGRYIWNNQVTDDDFKKAVAYYQQAIAIDPDSALAQSALANSFIRMGAGEYGLVAPSDIMPQARKAALEGLVIDESLAEAHLSLAMVRFRYEHDWAGAEDEFVRAIELKDSDAVAHYMYAVYLMLSARFDGALREVKLAQQLNPLSPAIHHCLGLLFYLSGQHDEAIEQLQGTTALYPTFPLAHLTLGLALQARRRFEEAIVKIQQSLDIGGSIPLWRGLLGNAYAIAGRTDEATDVLNELLDSSKLRYVPKTAVALVYAGLGKRDDAFRWLERSRKEPDGLLVYLKVAAVFDGLRPDPRFQQLLSRLGFLENVDGPEGRDFHGDTEAAPSYREQLDALPEGERKTEPDPPVPENLSNLLKVAIGTAILIGAALFWFMVPPQPSILGVRPFKNLSGDPVAQQIAGGLTEEMVSGFGQLPRNRPKIIELPPVEASVVPASIGTEPKSTYRLQGTVQVVQHEVAITAQLILVADQARIWGDSYERSIRDP